MKYLIVVLFIGFTVYNCASSAKKQLREASKQHEFEIVKDLVKSRQFNFYANRALPQGGANIDIAGNTNEVVINEEIGSFYLPYFGQRYFRSGHNQEGGIKSEATELLNYAVEIDSEKRFIYITFSIRQDQELLDMRFSIASRASVSLDVSSTERSSISYLGRINSLDAPL